METNKTIGELVDETMSKDRYSSRDEAINEVVAEALVFKMIAAERAKREKQKAEEGR